jgi:hypothetical protein
VIWLIGAHAIIFGILPMAFAFGIKGAVETPATEVALR